VTDVNDEAATKGDLKQQEADLKEYLKQFATKDELHAWGNRMMTEIARAASATADEMRRWFTLLLEKHDSDVAALHTNTAQLRTELEAHRDDAAVHVRRAPRRRSRG